MSPPAYRSSYMANKKASTYGESLGTRRYGNHLPRIASGDGDDHADDRVEDPAPQPEKLHVYKPMEDTRSQRQRREDRIIKKAMDIFAETAAKPIPAADAVAGVPGRLRLPKKETKSIQPSPLVPSSRLNRGLWADTQRHLLQAHEYLCHVGEAQQWIEGCLTEELGFGIVEMEDGLRNGVVLAKLVRAIHGERAVRRIYDAPKLDFRHSDNINHFFLFVRNVGLPECFIFELTDLYEKKNLPKVIYCIHALSHLLARRGMAQRINNLLGKLTFSDEQLQKTQKGLAGVPMPNFGNVGRELAQEINEEPEEPEPEPETEDERRDRLLLENEDSITALQSRCRGWLARQEKESVNVRLRLAERHVAKLQAVTRGALARARVARQRKNQVNLTPWAIQLQTRCRASLQRRAWSQRLRRIRSLGLFAIMLQAHARGVIQRRRYTALRAALRNSKQHVTKLQTILRASQIRRSHKQLAKTLHRPQVLTPIAGLQAQARGVLLRRRLARVDHALARCTPNIVALQGHCRGLLARRRVRNQLNKLEDISDVVVRIQAAVRTFLARRRLLFLIRDLRRSSPLLVGLQARARANLARQQHTSLVKALAEVQVIRGLNLFQARARAAIQRNHHQEVARQLETIVPDMVAVQSTCRGALVRLYHHAWRDHLRRNHPVATILQAMLRGALLRKNFRAKIDYYRRNLSKVVKIQSLFRAKETREQYRQLTMGKNVTVGTIKNFVHLLDDSESDFQEEIKVERLRKRVLEGMQETQALHSVLDALDTKIALVVENAKSFEELMNARRRLGADSIAAHDARAKLLAAHGDPFAGPNTLDAAAKRKLDLYQQLFYLLQTKAEYLSRIFLKLAQDDASEVQRRLTERVVLKLYGYGHDRRENYLLLKLFQLSIEQEVSCAKSLQDVIHGHPMFINIALQYIREHSSYIRDTFQTTINQVVKEEDLDLECNPTMIYRNTIDRDEMRSGVPNKQSREIAFHEALDNPDTRAEYIRHLQVLQWWTETFMKVIIQSTRKLPYNIRFLARETLNSLRTHYPDATNEECATCIGRLIFARYINPALLAPETFDIVKGKVEYSQRKNLAQISIVLNQITSGREFGDDNPSYLPINDFVRQAIAEMTQWLLQIANVADAETQLHAHEFLDAVVQPKPIYITPNEIYSMHTLLSQQLDFVAPTYNDPMRAMLTELGGVPNPHLGNDELKDARDSPITLELTNAFGNLKDPKSEEKSLWVQAKRGVLAILRVQPAQDLVEALMRPVTEDDELMWEDILVNEVQNEARQHQRRMPSQAVGDSGYRLEDIRALSFKEVKAHTIFFLLELEKQGKISRGNGFQDVLNAIAGDVRSKHRKRVERQTAMDSMKEALRQLEERKRSYEERINVYTTHFENSMSTMQRGKGKKRFTLPFTKQYYHDRDLKRHGQAPAYGSFIYTAKHLYEKRVLISVNQYSPRQFDKLQITFSSKTPGVFNVLLETTNLGGSGKIANEDVRMETLLQLKYENKSSVSLFNGTAEFNLQEFIGQINKKFYV